MQSFQIWGGGGEEIGAPPAEANHGGEICRRRAANFADFYEHRRAAWKAYIRQRLNRLVRVRHNLTATLINEPVSDDDVHHVRRVSLVWTSLTAMC